MNCPYCKQQNHLEIDMHSDGYSTGLIECSECGALLKLTSTNLVTVHGPAKHAGASLFHPQIRRRKEQPMQCPICQDSHYTKAESNFDGFVGGSIKECGRCGAVWSKTDKEVSMISVPSMSYVVGAASAVQGRG